jgi:hypothetical protein
MKLRLIIIGILLSFHVFADGYLPASTSEDQPWSIIFSGGYGKYQSLYRNNGESALGRFAVSNEMMLTGDLAWGWELGVQTGHRLRLNISNETLVVLNWLPVRTALGPMVDLLITAKTDPLAGSAVFALLKGGVAYRYWQVDNSAIKDFSQLTGEIQAGLGYPLTALANLNLLYQGIYGGDPNLKLNTYTRSGYISNIPTLHAVLLGLSVNL